MEQTSTQRARFVQELRTEIDHHYPRGRLAVAVDGADPARTGALADELADVYRDDGREALRASLGGTARDFDEIGFRRAVIEPFRARADDAVLIVDGSFLLSAPLKGLWHFTVYADAADAHGEPEYLAEVAPFFAASLVVDLSDPEAPKRIFSDSC